MDKQIAVGIIGLGLISRMHIEAYRRRKDFVIGALSDSNQPILTKKGMELAITALYPDYRTMLENVSLRVIDVLTPHYLHVQCVTDALHHGKTVICEKPFVTNLRDMDKIIEAAKKTKRYIYIKQYLRHSLGYQKAQELIHKDAIGYPYHIQCTFTSDSRVDYTNPNIWKGNKKEAGGGVFIDVGVHMLDLLIMMFGIPVATIARIAKISSTLPQKGEDFFASLIEFPNHLMVNITCTENDVGFGFGWDVRIFGTKGILTITDYGKKKKVLRIMKNNVATYTLVEHDWWEQANIRALNDIMDRIVGGRPPEITFGHARKVLYTILQSYQSGKTGKKQLLTYR